MTEFYEWVDTGGGAQIVAIALYLILFVYVVRRARELFNKFCEFLILEHEIVAKVRSRQVAEELIQKYAQTEAGKIQDVLDYCSDNNASFHLWRMLHRRRNQWFCQADQKDAIGLTQSDAIVAWFDQYHPDRAIAVDSDSSLPSHVPPSAGQPSEAP